MREFDPLAECYDAHAGALYPFLLGMLRHEADARDVLQEVFVKLARQPALLDGVQSVRAFLLRLAYNAAIDLVRRRQNRERHHEAEAVERAEVHVSAADPDEQAFREALAAALGELPLEQRTVVHLKLWEQFTFEEIATTLDISPNTAASRYRYGIDKLRARLRPLYDEIQ